MKGLSLGQGDGKERGRQSKEMSRKSVITDRTRSVRAVQRVEDRERGGKRMKRKRLRVEKGARHRRWGSAAVVP